MHLALLLVILFAPRGAVFTNVAFNVFLANVWGTVLALLSPDMRNYYLFFEVETFWIEHVSLLVIPLYVAFSRRLVVLPTTKDLVLTSFCCFALYHSLVLSGVALLTGQNLNYMLSPPPLDILKSLGSYYRLVMYGFSLILTWFTRYVLLDGVVFRLVGRQWLMPSIAFSVPALDLKQSAGKANTAMKGDGVIKTQLESVMSTVSVSGPSHTI